MKRLLIIALVFLCASAVIFASCVERQQDTDKQGDDTAGYVNGEVSESSGVDMPFKDTQHDVNTEKKTGESLNSADYEKESNEKAAFAEYPIRMIMADGYLYYDTGEVSKLTSRCGTLDAHFSSFCSEEEIPSADGMANFKTGDGITGWQNASDVTKEVYLDTGWMIFKRLEHTSDIREHGFNRCVRRVFSDGSEYLMFYCESDFKDGSSVILEESGTEVITVPVKYGSVYDWGITLSAKDISESGLTLVISQSGGSAAGELQTGTYFGLDRKKDNIWIPVEPIIDNAAWKMLSYMIKDGEETQFRCDWEWLYGKLPKGTYRISKEIMDFKAAGNYDTHLYYLEFEIVAR